MSLQILRTAAHTAAWMAVLALTVQPQCLFAQQLDSVEPLPFQGMESYPFPDGVSYPDSDFHRKYLETWQTRELGAPASGTPATGGAP